MLMFNRCIISTYDANNFLKCSSYTCVFANVVLKAIIIRGATSAAPPNSAAYFSQVVAILLSV